MIREFAHIGIRRRWVWIILVVLLADGGLLRLWLRSRRWHSQDAMILRAARRYHVDPALVKAVVWKESQFNPDARGRAGEIGLMQVREVAGREWARAEGKFFWRRSDLFDPGENTLAGTWYLNKLLQRYSSTDNPVAYALADYNAGRRNVLRWAQGASATNSARFITQIDFPSTRAYVAAILEQRGRFGNEFR